MRYPTSGCNSAEEAQVCMCNFFARLPLLFIPLQPGDLHRIAFEEAHTLFIIVGLTLRDCYGCLPKKDAESFAGCCHIVVRICRHVLCRRKGTMRKRTASRKQRHSMTASGCCVFNISAYCTIHVVCLPSNQRIIPERKSSDRQSYGVVCSRENVLVRHGSRFAITYPSDSAWRTTGISAMVSRLGTRYDTTTADARH